MKDVCFLFFVLLWSLRGLKEIFLVYELNYDVTNEINHQKISVMEYFLYSSSIFRKIVTLFYLVTGRKWDGGGKNIKKGNSS